MKRKIAIIFSLFLVVLLSIYFAMPLFPEYKEFRSQIDTSIRSGIEYVISGKKTKKIEVTDEKINEIGNLINKKGDLSVSVTMINAVSGKKYQAGTTDTFNGASTTKVISAVCYLRRAEAGYASFNDPLGDYTAEFQFKQMLNQSNNDSLDLINGEIGIYNLTNCAKSIGVPSFEYYANTLSPSEISDVLLKLSRYELISREHTDIMLSYMQHINEERLIPAFLPEGYTAYHKYGILNGNLHDAAIIKGNGEEYILSIYTDGPNLGESQLNDRINFFKEIMGILFR